MGYRVLQPDDIQFAERGYLPEQPPRSAARLTDQLHLEHARATLWRYPPGVRGRRHREGAQEEVFVVLDGTITMLLGDPGDRVEVAAGGIVKVDPGTPLQVRNESGAEARVLIWGAPPETGKSEILDDPG